MAGNRINKSDGAQISLDFLIGISVFMIAFLFILTYLPGLFAPFTSNSDVLTMTSDRVAAVLVNNVLAENNSGSISPAILDETKINSFAADMADPDKNSKLRASLGLNETAGTQYDLEVIIEEQGAASPIVINNGHSAISMKGNMGQSRRFAYIRDPGAPAGDYGNYPGRVAVITVRVW